MPSEPPRSPLSVGVYWASRVTSLALEFTLPALAGMYVDKQLGSMPLGTIIGAVLGMAVGMLHVLQFAKDRGQGERPSEEKGERRK